MIAWKTGDTGLTASRRPYRIIADDLVGYPGPLVAVVRREDADHVVRYQADGKHPGKLPYQDLMPPKVRA
ncbi:MAG: hypothetical protein FD144_2620 [Rhodospirillaceae bacterium]|nr:MAG: hypothetical protein FD144_2620 [Rhodospirillaceae bacterium]